ncbi:MAG: flagellar motor switch protein FliM [Bryobacterales bacterium]|nr:flagellar motor switch protein FliM [Bryobacterales bacterium]
MNQLSQAEIDRVFEGVKETVRVEAPPKVVAYDFRRLDRVSKEQLRGIHLLHNNFARNLAASLSAYLRAYVIVNLVSIEQLSFAEFTQCLPSPTCMIWLGMKPFDGAGVLELNPSLMFPLLEMLLGGNVRGLTRVNREATEIEQQILDTLFRIMLHDLKEAWQGVSNINFTIEGHETEPQLLQILAPTEAVVSVGLEVRIGETTGMLNIAVPSITIKMLRHRFDRQWSVRKTDSTEEEQSRMLSILMKTNVSMEVRLQGPSLSIGNLMSLNIGDVLSFDHIVGKPLALLANGKTKYHGQVVAQGRKRAFVVETLES